MVRCELKKIIQAVVGTIDGKIWSQGVQLGWHRGGPGNDSGDLNGSNKDGEKEKVIDYVV